MRTIPLTSPDVVWTLRPDDLDGAPEAVTRAFAHEASIPAQVPGCVHDDLLAAGLIPDPYLGTDEQTDAWIGHRGWCYRAELPSIPKCFERIELVADGLDTVANLALDGLPVGQTANQHRGYRFTLVERSGGTLSVDFADIYATAAALRAQIGDYPASYDQPFNYTRKMASNFGWDWGPTVVTAGIWKDIRLEAWSTARLVEVRPQVGLDAPDGHRGHVRITASVERTLSGADVPLTLRAILRDGSGAIVARSQVVLRDRDLDAELDLDAGSVQRWWPWDLGDQPLYDLAVTLESDERLDEWAGRIGFRSIDLDTTPEADGRAFTFVVAGQPVFARGFNWIPDDLLVHRVTRDDYRARLQDAKDAGATLIRVWGGGIFEKDEFYEVCDELGLMVWQDCLFACAAYPETEEFTEQVRAEVHQNAVRLMPHPSLVLWNGCNENLWGHVDWGWQEVLGERGWGARYYFEIIPEVLAQVDPGRPYWPGSPYSGDDEHHPDDPAYGCYHAWDVWNNLDFTHYLDASPRFVAEFGWCGPAAYATLRDAIGEEHMRIDDPVYMSHYKAHDGAAKVRRAISDGFSEPADFDTWHYAQQVQQARAVQLGIDWWRSTWPRCAGAVIWQLNDCWPVTSWAAVDGAGVRKPVWYAVRQSFAEHAAVVFPGHGCYQLSLSNLGATAWQARPLIRRVSLSGQIRASWTRTVRVPAGQVVHLDLPLDVVPAPTQYEPAAAYASGLAGDEVVVIDTAGSRRILAWPDRDLLWTPPRYAVRIDPTRDGGRVTVTALGVVRDLLLQADRLGAQASHDLVTLLPGESHTWHVTGLGRPLTEHDCAAPVLLCAADVEVRARG